MLRKLTKLYKEGDIGGNAEESELPSDNRDRIWIMLFKAGRKVESKCLQP